MSARTVPARPRLRPATVVVPVVVILLVVLAGLIIRESPAVTAWELGVVQALSDAHAAPLDALCLGINWLFSPPIAAVIVVLCALGVLGVTRRVRPLVAFVTLAVVPWLGNDLIKVIVARPRPDVTSLSHQLIPAPSSFSYPSGHAAFAASLCLALLFTVGAGRLRPLFLAVAVVVPVLTAFSRVYLGVHYPTDVVASLVYVTAAAILIDALLNALFARLDRDHSAPDAHRSRLTRHGA
ncbi:phosphatase PAP2 family protein [Leifsonia sp. NPDC058248]|uniref:phosphatase PAP2 family protein n=1 Tax=Leifsonia sp. NPDC058248 TaxID=3346402 RepID=UPI0036DAD115